MYQTEKGKPAPLGASLRGNGINFALFSQQAQAVTLCLFAQGSKYPFIEIPLDPKQHKTGDIWHILLTHLPHTSCWEYGYQVAGVNTLLSDPYARGLTTSIQWGHDLLVEERPPIRGKIIFDPPFDWQNDTHPNLPLEQLIIYEMHVRAFTQHSSSQVTHPGTFLGIVEKIPYLKALGINAVELLPVFEFDECGLKAVNPKTHLRLTNLWGYATINFFSPMNRFASSIGWTAAIDEFRTMVREFHKAGIEVYLDVVYNHTAEGDHTGPCFSFRGIDDTVYYLHEPDHSYSNYSGTGNTFNANHPIVSQLILDSLRYWVEHMHVDGFRFDLASCLTRDEKGQPLVNPPLISAITNDPILSKRKLIAEAWDAGGLYQVGQFPGDGKWLEWNGKYRDHIRRFMKGTDGQVGHFAQAMSGSEDLYGKWKTPLLSINFVTAHDGYSLHDLVSYQEKHNLDNLEENRDGTNQNDSWNCGTEGPTTNRNILLLRERQMRNHVCALLLSIGIPMMLMGDEYGHTRQGNNNAYCQDNALNWFLWDELDRNQPFFLFFQSMIAFRKTHPLLQRTTFFSTTDIHWHGHLPMKPNWGHDNRFVAYTLYCPKTGHAIYIAFNAHFQDAHIELPPSPTGRHWYRIVDTSLPAPHDFCTKPQIFGKLLQTYHMLDHSTLIAEAL